MASSPETLIAGRYSVDANRPLSDGGGGLPTFAAHDHRGGDVALIAVQVQRHAPARARALQMLGEPIDGILCPIAHGAAPGPHGEPGYFVISPAPPGPSLAAGFHAWQEHALIVHVLRPVALALEKLATANVTHRAIRLNNVFAAPRNQPLVLGAAWSAPPAMHQPALFEPPYVAMCHPAARGDGSIADDVYALGVLLLCLALGRVPLAGLDEPAILRRKLELGSQAALIGDERLSPVIADLVRGMLAEDPEHRPTPALLLDPAAARGRRVAARPPRRAQRPLAIAGIAAWDARTLAYAMAMEPEPALAALGSGAVMHWLRRGLGDAMLAARFEDMARHRAADPMADESRANALTLMRAIAQLDPLAPLCWRGIILWPDGIGSALAGAHQEEANFLGRLEEAIGVEAVGAWAAARAEHCDVALLRLEGRQYRAWLATRGLAGGTPRLMYMLNPLLPCASPLMGTAWVGRLTDVLPALEAAAPAKPASGPLDRHVAAFVAARADRRLETEINALSDAGEQAIGSAELRLLAQLQIRTHPKPVPALAAWVAGKARGLVTAWHNRPRRAEVAERLNTLAQAGMLMPMLQLLEDPAGRVEDARGARLAAAELAQIDAELATITERVADRNLVAERLGQEIAAGVGLAALAGMLAAAALG